MLRFGAPSRTMRMLLAAAAAAVCLAQSGTPDYAAKVIVQFGQVSALTANGQRPLSIGDSLKPQQMIVTGADGYAKFQVSDGSTFEVFANSKMLFREHLGNLEEILNVVIGRVKVYIQHLNGLDNYNKVTSPTAVISVRGTVFDVVVEDDEGTTFVSVDEGVVNVRNWTAPGDSVNLRAGDSIRVIRNQPLQALARDKSLIMRGILRAAEDAAHVVLQPGGVRGPMPGGGVPAPAPTGNGDKGKGTGTGTAPSAPGAPGPPPSN
jgi:ferric-dicitrate binding protein FerR (iron transport regulator)